jgi:hypothetical protein
MRSGAQARRAMRESDGVRHGLTAEAVIDVLEGHR